MNKRTKIFLGILAAGFFFVGFPMLMSNSFERELRRKEVVHQHNCEHYGPAMNKHYGREVCPPTPRG